MTFLIGPNGSGKTHLLRAIKESFKEITKEKKVRFVSAGRMGPIEVNRSDYDGYRNNLIDYDGATFGDKNDLNRRHLIETLNGDFQTLSERADILVKVQERLRKLFKRDIIISWDAGRLKVDFSRMDTEGLPYSSGREASGLLHLVGLLSAIYDDEVGVLILDEPEVSLHPQLQAFLLNEIISASGHYSESGFKKIILMATHSTEMINILTGNDFKNIIFCYDVENQPIQIDHNVAELKNRKIKSLISRLGQEHKLSLFCKRPLLVEGPSDVLICTFLSKKLGVHLEASGSQILPVIGKDQMPIVSKFMRLMGKEPVILADADAFTDNMDLTNYLLSSCPEADEKACRGGAKSAYSLASSAYNDFCQLVTAHWDDVSQLAINHPYWVNKGDCDDDKAKRRSAFSIIFSVDDTVIGGFLNAHQWISIKNRLEATLNLLEIAGCFILRKGAIESYYKSSDPLTSEGKPSAAVDEITYLDSISSSSLLSSFPEIIRCINFASRAEKINEADSLKDILLAIAAPAIAKFNVGAKTQELVTLNKAILRERAELFSLSADDEKLTISLNSNILSVSGFPLVLHKGDDVVSEISKALQSS
nr:AAA family ATPase [Rosenbergiella nectarea]